MKICISRIMVALVAVSLLVQGDALVASEQEAYLDDLVRGIVKANSINIKEVRQDPSLKGTLKKYLTGKQKQGALGENGQLALMMLESEDEQAPAPMGVPGGAEWAQPAAAVAELLTPALMQKAVAAYEAYKKTKGRTGATSREAVKNILDGLISIDRGEMHKWGRLNEAQAIDGIQASRRFLMPRYLFDSDFDIAITRAIEEAAKGPAPRKKAIAFLTELYEQMRSGGQEPAVAPAPGGPQ